MNNTLPLAKREPVAIRAAVVAAVTAIVHALVVAGVVDRDTEKALAPIVDLVGLIVAVLWARSGATANAKVVARVSPSRGVVVAGEASTVPTGQEVDASPSGTRVVVPVDQDLLNEADD